MKNLWDLNGSGKCKERAGIAKKVQRSSPTVFTVGHSTRSLEAFIGVLRENSVKKVVDIRTIRRSRHNPQFNQETLPDHLKASRIGYIHIAGLGGLRHTRRDSLNAGWRNSSFRGFADYMQTEEFEKSLERLIQLANRQQVALMCAEAVPWRCHRFLVADALKVRDINVEHIMSLKQRQPHEITPWACVDGTQITYPPWAGCVRGRLDQTILTSERWDEK
jgi:uncharacterized protein (DUF488 family)